MFFGAHLGVRKLGALCSGTLRRPRSAHPVHRLDSKQRINSEKLPFLGQTEGLGPQCPEEQAGAQARRAGHVAAAR